MKSIRKILITGGNGYIGSCLSSVLYNKYSVSIIDKEKKSKFLPKKINYFKFDLKNKKKLIKTLKRVKPNIIIHLAAQSTIDMVDTKKHSYYLNNYYATKVLTECIKELKISNLIFSSTAAVYEKKERKIKENSKIFSKNSYGKSKINCENLIKKLDQNTTKFCILRFFNVASSIVKKKIGEIHNPETHLIPIIIHSILNKKKFKVYGNNYPTKDGTCLRDYIHILDITRGIEKSIKFLLKKNTKSNIFNLGSGKSYSVKEVVKCAFRITKRKTIINYQNNRKHDSIKLVCSIKKANKILEWKPLYSNLEKIIKDEIWWYNYLKKKRYTRKYIY